MYSLNTELLTLTDIAQVLTQSITLDERSQINIQKCRDFLDRKMQDVNKTYYGINTGFGALCNVKISNEDIEQLQENLVLSHACGLGQEVPPHIVKLMLLLKIQNFVYGHSGISLKVVERLIAFYNQDILPVVYQLGSLGASADLAPLAHLSLPILGKGMVYHQGVKKEAAQLEFPPLTLQSKEGLALLNGTQFMRDRKSTRLNSSH